MPKRTERPGEVGGHWLSRRANSAAWCRTWFDPATRQTRRVSLGTEDLEQAKMMLAEWVTTHARMDRERSDMVTLARVLARHYQHHGRHLRSAEAVRYSLAHWNEFFQGALVSEITAERQRAFIKNLRGRGLSDGYIRRVLADGKAAINRVHREGEIAQAPFIALVPESEPRERVATLHEVAWLFRAAEQDHVRMYLMLAIGTAARPEAILQLTRFQVDCDARLITLNPRGRRQTKKRRPVVPICDALLPCLRAAPAGVLIEWAGKPLKSIRTTFNRLKVRGAALLRAGAAAVARRQRASGRRAEAWATIDGAKAEAAAMLELTPYTLRHTMATELRRRGVPVWEVAGILGHSSGYKTTERYAKFGPDHLSGAVRAIDAYFADLGAVLGGARLGPSFNQARASCVLPG